jgi:hypothetical protein
MSEAVHLPEKIEYSLVKFAWETGAACYTNSTTDKLGPDGLTYVATPDMSIVLPPNRGTLDRIELKIELSLEKTDGTTDTFLDEVANTRCTPHAPVTVTVLNYLRPTTGGPLTLVDHPFRGRLEETILNPDEKTGVVRLIALPAKSKMEVALGIQCNPECENALGDAGCKINLASSSFSLTGQLTAINGSTVTIVNPTVRPDRFYHRGFVSFGGLAIGIRDWRDTDPTTFILLREPPASWLNETVRFTAGCDKTAETCLARFNNLANFLGIGRVVPAYNPLTKG